MRFAGQEILGLPNKQMRHLWGAEMSMVFQNPLNSLNPLMKIGKQITEPLKLHLDMDRANAEATAVQLLRDVHIPEAERRLGDVGLVGAGRGEHGLDFGEGQGARLGDVAFGARDRVLQQDERREERAACDGKERFHGGGRFYPGSPLLRASASRAEGERAGCFSESF